MVDRRVTKRCCEQVQSLSDLDCRGEKMANGGTVIKVRDDFTKCNMLVEEVKDYDQDGNLYVTDYKFTNHLIHDAGQDSVSNTMFLRATGHGQGHTQP